MSQLKYLINSTRIPKPDKDQIVKFENSKHILVIHKGRMYTFNIFQSDGRGVAAKQIMSNIRFILNQPSGSHDEQPGLGVLTTMKRDKWASTRELLIQLGNKDVLKQVDSAVFAISLDSNSYKDESEMVHNTLHGPAENRWFDKSFTLIVDSKGDAAVNFEHSWGDGIAIKRYFDEVFDDSELNPQFSKKMSSDYESSLPPPEVNRITFHLNAKITDEILPRAKTEYDEKRNLIDLQFARYEGFGENSIVGTKLGSDALLQLCFQMAHYKLKHKQAATYESVTTSSFKDGRTETLRPATVESKRVCQLMAKSSTSSSELYSAILECSKKHSKLTIDGLMGQGWDRHLMGLRYCAEQSGKMPDIFTDPSYTDINKIILSTSTVPSDAIDMGGFAAVCQDGYGIAYGIKCYVLHTAQNDECGAIISSWKDSSYSNGSQFRDALMESIKHLSGIIELNKRKDTTS